MSVTPTSCGSLSTVPPAGERSGLGVARRPVLRSLVGRSEATGPKVRPGDGEERTDLPPITHFRLGAPLLRLGAR